MTSAIDILQYTQAKLGDEVVSFGYGHTAKAWSGSVSQEQTKADEKDNVIIPWTSNADDKIASGEILVQASQHDGMSGGAVSNGCGYVGMAHLVNTANGLTNFAHVIPADVVTKFALKHFNLLMECPGVKAESLLLLPFMNCAIQAAQDNEIDICPKVNNI
jgi:hypothetical protein